MVHVHVCSLFLEAFVLTFHLAHSHSLSLCSSQPIVTLHMTLMLKVIARSQHTSTLQQKKLVLARLMCVQEHTSLANCFVL